MAALSLLGGAVYLLQAGVTARSDIPAALRCLSLLEPQLAAAKSNQPPPPAEIAAMRQRVNALNAISGPRGATSALFAWLEQHLPGDVALASLQYRARDGERSCWSPSRRGGTLTKFLLRLEPSRASPTSC